MKKISKRVFIFVFLLQVLFLSGCSVSLMGKEFSVGNPSDGGRDRFAGQWVDETNPAWTLDLYRDDAGDYSGMITVPRDDSHASFWEFHAVAGSRRLSYTDAVRVDVDYSADGVGTENVIYEEGHGTLKLKGEKLYWTDEKEDAGHGVVFVPLIER